MQHLNNDIFPYSVLFANLTYIVYHDYIFVSTVFSKQLDLKTSTY